MSGGHDNIVSVKIRCLIPWNIAELAKEVPIASLVCSTCKYM